MQKNASKPKSWPLQSSCKKNAVADEEDILLLQVMQDTLLACKDYVDDASAYYEEEGDDAKHRNELLDELELGEVKILRRMAQKAAVPTQLREKVRILGRRAEIKSGDGSARHRQSKLKTCGGR